MIRHRASPSCRRRAHRRPRRKSCVGGPHDRAHPRGPTSRLRGRRCPSAASRAGTTGTIPPPPRPPVSGIGGRRPAPPSGAHAYGGGKPTSENVSRGAASRHRRRPERHAAPGGDRAAAAQLHAVADGRPQPPQQSKTPTRTDNIFGGDLIGEKSLDEVIFGLLERGLEREVTLHFLNMAIEVRIYTTQRTIAVTARRRSVAPCASAASTSRRSTAPATPSRPPVAHRSDRPAHGAADLLGRRARSAVSATVRARPAPASCSRSWPGASPHKPFRAQLSTELPRRM